MSQKLKWYHFLVGRILIIYSKAGGGHLSLAQGLEEALNEYFPGKFQITLFDPFPKIYASGYKTVGANFQDFWGKNFHLTDRPEIAKAIHTINEALILPRLKKIITQTQPDLIATTHALATVEVAKALEETGHSAKIAVLIADPFTPHLSWFTYKDADLYLSPTPEVTNLAVSMGIPPGKIKTTGWVVRRKFRESRPTLEAGSLRRTLGFEKDKFTIFLGGSGAGGGKIYQVAKLMARPATDKKHLSEVNCQVVAVCGMNRKLLVKIMKLAEDRPKLFHLFPYVNNVRELMAASNVVVGKAGPNLLFESILTGKPFLATGCLPGQEDGNLEFIKREDLGWVIPDPKGAVKLLEELISHRELIEEKLPNLKRVRQDHLNGARKAAEEVARLVED